MQYQKTRLDCPHSLYLLARQLGYTDVFGALKCLYAASSFELDNNLYCKIHSLLGIIHYSQNLGMQFLQKACASFENVILDNIVFEAASLLSGLYCKMRHYDKAEDVLRNIIDVTNDNYWYIRLMHELACIDFIQSDFQSAFRVLELIFKFSEKKQLQSTVHTCIFYDQSIILFCTGNYDRGMRLLEKSNPMDDLSSFIYLILSVFSRLTIGKIKDAGYCVIQLRNLLSRGTTVEGEYSLCGGRWLDSHALNTCAAIAIGAYQVHCESVLTTDKFLVSTLVSLERGVSTPFRFILEHHIYFLRVICNLMTPNLTVAISQIEIMVHLVQQNQRGCTDVHLLLGLYSLSTNMLNAAITQFIHVIETSTDPYFKSFTTANLVFLYLLCDRHTEFNSLIMVTNNMLKDYPSDNTLVVVKVIKTMTLIQLNQMEEAKESINDTLGLANVNHFRRLSNTCMSLLGYILSATNEYNESINLLNQSYAITIKLNDSSLQLWILQLQKRLYEIHGETRMLASLHTTIDTITSTLDIDLHKAIHSRVNNLIYWVDGPIPRT